MKKIFPGALGALLLFLTTLASAPDADAGLHFQLVKAAPADEAMLTEAPEAIKLWFSQVPQMEGARIRLIDSADEQVKMGAVKQDADDGKVIWAPVEGPVADGSYRIAWRAMARDGHMVTGELTFTVNTDRSR